MRPFSLLTRISFALAGFLALEAGAQDGATLFKQNCSACHKLGGRLVGPDLIGVNDRRTKDWLHEFIKGSQAMIKRGDPTAVQVYKENNELIMTDQALSTAEIDLVLEYIASQGQPAGATAAAAAAPAEPEAPVEYTDADREAGRRLFVGATALSGRGAACISCHNVDNPGTILGGGLAKDLTGAYGRLGHAGIAGILNAPPFPAMASAYGNAPLTEQEVHELAAFLDQANRESAQAKAHAVAMPFAIYGGGGLLVILAIIGLHWRNRLRGSVKQDILDRQLRSI